jgi:hypothetical protein
MMQVFEEVTTRNVKAVVQHANLTRDLVKELETKVKSLDGLVRQYDAKIELLQKQIVVLQTKLFSGGS